MTEKQHKRLQELEKMNPLLMSGNERNEYNQLQLALNAKREEAKIEPVTKAPDEYDTKIVSAKRRK